MATNNLICYNKPWATNNQRFIMNKICRRCKEEKRLKQFKTDSRNSDGRTKTCRECYTKRQLDSFFRTPEQIEAQRSKLLGRKYSIEHRRAISEGNLRAIAEGRHQWKPRKEKDPDNLRNRFKYVIWRQQVKELRGAFCDTCKSDKSLHVHHIKSFYKYPELRYDVNNGQVLCVSCHMKLTWVERKANDQQRG